MNFTNQTMSVNSNTASNLEDQNKRFWKEKQLHKYDGRQFKAKALPPMRLAVRKNELDMCEDLAVRPIEACWVENDEVVAYATGLLYGAALPGVEINSEEMVDECDIQSQHYYDVSDMLYWSHARQHPFCDIGVNSQWLAEIGTLEVHPKHRGKGIGVKLGLQFIEVLKRNHKICFFFFKPYPLQYSESDGPREFFDREIYPKDFERDRQKLFELYRQAWKAKELPGATDYMWISGSTGQTLQPQDGGACWDLCQVS